MAQHLAKNYVPFVVPPWLELRARGRSTRVFTIHMLLFLGLLTAGCAMIDREGAHSEHSYLAIGMLALAVLTRCGVVPVHCWMTDLFENATLGTALLFVAPMPGAYAAVRLMLPVAPEWALRGIALLSLLTAVYAAGMALIQHEARRFFCYLFLSNASLVLVGLEVATPTSLTGGLAVWLSVGISLAGLGLTLRALEARCGRLSLSDYHGLYEHMPSLAVFFLLTGLASIGFPGTIGFVGEELLVEGVVQVAPLVGMIVVFAAALNGIAFMRAYFRLFTGAQHTSSISLEARWPERVAVLTMTVLILGGGLLPQPGVASRYRAATEIIARRQVMQSSARLPQDKRNLPSIAKWSVSEFRVGWAAPWDLLRKNERKSRCANMAGALRGTNWRHTTPLIPLRICHPCFRASAQSQHTRKSWQLGNYRGKEAISPSELATRNANEAPPLCAKAREKIVVPTCLSHSWHKLGTNCTAAWLSPSFAAYRAIPRCKGRL